MSAGCRRGSCRRNSAATGRYLTATSRAPCHRPMARRTTRSATEATSTAPKREYPSPHQMPSSLRRKRYAASVGKVQRWLKNRRGRPDRFAKAKPAPFPCGACDDAERSLVGPVGRGPGFRKIPDNMRSKRHRPASSGTLTSPRRGYRDKPAAPTPGNSERRCSFACRRC